MEWQFDLCGDHLALDFANTVSDRESEAPIERLPGYADLVAFARQSGIIGQTRFRTLLSAANDRPREAAQVLHRAVALRDALYRLFAAVARGVRPAENDVRALDGEMYRLGLGVDLALTWRRAPDALDDFLGAIVQAAVGLATRPEERGRVRICEAPDCEWLFYDGSRNRSRRWCDMRQCGNRMKARRHYARARRGP